MNELMTKMFVKQPLASPGSANTAYQRRIVKFMVMINQINQSNQLRHVLSFLVTVFAL